MVKRFKTVRQKPFRRENYKRKSSHRKTQRKIMKLKKKEWMDGWMGFGVRRTQRKCSVLTFTISVHSKAAHTHTGDNNNQRWSSVFTVYCFRRNSVSLLFGLLNFQSVCSGVNHLAHTHWLPGWLPCACK